MSRNIRPPVTCHGGKYYLVDRLDVLAPPHRYYMETHVGGGSFALNKTPCDFTTINDLNDKLMNVWQQIKDHYDFINFHLKQAAYTEATWRDSLENIHHHDRRIAACAYIIKYRMSRGGLGTVFSWSDRTRGGQPGDVNGWETFVYNELPNVHDKVKFWNIFCMDAIECVHEFGDNEEMLIYADPPYLQMTRTTKQAYGLYEMTPKEHFQLIVALNECRAQVMLSGYRSELYNSLLIGWRRIDIPMKNNAGQNKIKQDRIESIWIKRQ